MTCVAPPPLLCSPQQAKNNTNPPKRLNVLLAVSDVRSLNGHRQYIIASCCVYCEGSGSAKHRAHALEQHRSLLRPKSFLVQKPRAFFNNSNFCDCPLFYGLIAARSTISSSSK